MRLLPNRAPLRFDAVHGDAAEKFWIEVGGLLGHDFVARGDLNDFFDAHGIEEKGNLGLARIDSSDGGSGFAFVGKVHLFCGGLERDAERRFENAVVKKNNVEIALERRNTGQKLGKVRARPQSEKIKSALACRSRGIRANGTLLRGGGKAGEEFFLYLRFFGVARKRKNFGSEPGLKIAANRVPRKIMNVGYHTMGGENDEAFAARVDESHHGALVGGIKIG